MSLSVSQPQNITSPNGNSLAVYIDGLSGIMMLKDIYGKIEPISNYFASGTYSPYKYNTNGSGIEAILGTNLASGTNAVVGGGCSNTSSSNFSAVVGGQNNTVSGVFSNVSGGCSNLVSGCCSVISGGSQNTVNSNHSAIIGGSSNHTCGFACSVIVGSNLCATQACTTFMNCASVNNLTEGCFVCTGSNKVLTNASFTPLRGLFSQTANSTPITATTVEGTLIDGGVGTLTVPANGFAVGDSFMANLGGVMSARNNDTITIRVKSGSVVLAQSAAFVLPNINNQVWQLSVWFTIRTLGAATVASIVTLGEMHILKLASGTQEGFAFNTINNTTFNTTISNTLDITAQWSSNSATNSIYSDLFMLTKTY
jgi:hypothetical protein